MGTTAQKLQAIVDSKAAIKSSLQTKFNKPEFNLTLNDKLADWSVAIEGYGKTWKAKPRIQTREFSQKYGAQYSIGASWIANTDVWADRTIETVDFSDLSAVGQFGLYAAFSCCPNIKTIIWNERHSLPNYTDPQGSVSKYTRMFQGCEGLSGDLSVDLSEGTASNPSSNSFQGLFNGTRFSTADVKLTETLNASDTSYNLMLANNPALTKVVMRGLKNLPYASSGTLFGSSANNYLFNTNVSEIEFPDLEWVGYENSDGAYTRTLYGWIDTNTYEQRITMRFPKLRWFGIKGSLASHCWLTGATSAVNYCLEHIYLPSCVHLGQYAFGQCRGITIHYAAANRAAIESCTGAPTFGATDATVLYDL